MYGPLEIYFEQQECDWKAPKGSVNVRGFHLAALDTLVPSSALDRKLLVPQYFDETDADGTKGRYIYVMSHKLVSYLLPVPLDHGISA